MPSIVASYLARLSLTVILSLGAIVAAPVLQAVGPWPEAGLALADDDDDDGGDDDDDDGGGGSPGDSVGRGGGDDDGWQGSRRQGNLRSLFPWPFRQADRAPVRRAVAVPDRAPNDILAAGLSEQSISDLIQNGFGVDERRPVALTGGELVRLTIPPNVTLEAARQAVLAEEPSASVDFNHFYRPEQQDVSACGEGGCALVRHIVGWPSQASIGSCAAPLPIGLIDTAINAQHASLAEARIDVLRLDGEATPQSGEQHGTAVAALLVGAAGSRAPGLLPAARLVAVDAFRRYRETVDVANAYDLVRALDLLVARDIKVINLSLTGPANRLLEQAVRAALGKRTILIAATGNGGPNAKPAYPAAYPDVIAVTAVDKFRKPYRRAVQGDHVDIAAPGVGVWTAASISGGRKKTGTSFAAPFVTAAVSVLLGANPGMGPREVETELMRSASDMGVPGKDAVYGWGLLNVRTLCQM